MKRVAKTPTLRPPKRRFATMFVDGSDEHLSPEKKQENAARFAWNVLTDAGAFDDDHDDAVEHRAKAVAKMGLAAADAAARQMVAQWAVAQRDRSAARRRREAARSGREAGR